MGDLRQALLGIFAALVSSAIVIGSLALSLVEGGLVVAQVPATEAPAQVYPSPIFVIDTPAPGEPTFTPSPSPQPSPTTGLPTPTPPCAYPAGWLTYTVQAGDTLEGLAQARLTTAEALISGNCLPLALLLPGTTLFVPPLPEPPTPTASLLPTETQAPPPTATERTCNQPPPGWLAYTVRWGDTLAAISQWSGATVPELRKANCLKSDLIKTGQRLWVPRLPPPPTPIPYRTPTQIPVIPPTATVAPPTVAPPTQIPPTVAPPTQAPPTPVPPTPVPPTPVPSDTPIPPTPVPPTPVPPPTETQPPPPPTEPPTSAPTETVPVTEAPADLAATPTLAPPAPSLFASAPLIFEYRLTSVIIHPDGATNTAPDSPNP